MKGVSVENDKSDEGIVQTMTVSFSHCMRRKFLLLIQTFLFCLSEPTAGQKTTIYTNESEDTSSQEDEDNPPEEDEDNCGNVQSQHIIFILYAVEILVTNANISSLRPVQIVC